MTAKGNYKTPPLGEVGRGSVVFGPVFALAVVLFFGLAYPHHLHYQEQYQMFLFDGRYAWDIVRLPGGVADLLGRFCTQFFLYAWAGAFIIGAMLAAVQLLTLRLARWGWLYGLSFVPSFLLWLFLLDENALLGGVWAVLLALLASWGFDKVPEGWPRRVGLLLMAPLLYWMQGPVSLVFFLVQARRSGLSAWYVGALVLLALQPLLLAHCLPVPAARLWTGVHYHRYPTAFPTMLWVAALSASLLPLLAHALSRWMKGKTRPVALFASFVLVAAGMGTVVWKNCNFKAEKIMQYDFMARHQQWNRILDTISKEKPNNQIGVTVQNLALAMRGQLINRLSEYTQTDQTLGLCVYPYWHPSGRYIAYSTNATSQVFHMAHAGRVEVFDTASDLQVYDTERNELLLTPLLKQDSVYETYPVFSADGRSLYFCAARALPEGSHELDSIRYNLLRIDFDPATGQFGNRIDTIVNAEAQRMSVSFPRPSYDGRFLCYTLSRFGQFSIWHHEADLYLMDLTTGQSRPMAGANSEDTESFHNWSTNSRWMVFSSRRDDGLFTRPYFCHVDAKGRVSKAFMLPQRNPRRFYRERFFSFNVPDFITRPTRFDGHEAARLINDDARTCFGVRK